MVAGGGGGANTRCNALTSDKIEPYYGYGSGGAGGGLIGGSGTTEGQDKAGLESSYGYCYGTGGTQTSGGKTIGYINEIIVLDLITGNFGNATYEKGPIDPTNPILFGMQSGGGGGYYAGGYAFHGGGGRRFFIY